MKRLKDRIFRIHCKLLSLVGTKYVINRRYKHILHKKLNLDRPFDLNEKIQWLKLYSDISSWSILADKFEVRDYVKSKGLQDILIPLYGVWDSAEEIDFDQLPQNFVLKTNHGSGGVIIVHNKKDINPDSIKKILGKSLKYKYGIIEGEPHYTKIKPKIIAEKLLIQNNEVTNTLIDYKVWCFHGKPYCIVTYFNRTGGKVNISAYDLEWNYKPEWSVYNSHFLNGNGIIPKPTQLRYMLDSAASLSNGYPEMRVDFYEVDGKLYFGELTLTSSGGFIESFPQEMLNELGQQIRLPNL